MPPPAPPFHDWPLQRVDPGLGYAWFVEPATLVTQGVIAEGTTETTGRYMDIVDMVLAARGETIRDAGGLLIINDWRTLEKTDPASRKVLSQRMKERPKGYSRYVVVCMTSTSALTRMAFQALNMVSAVTGNGGIEVTDDIEAAMRMHDIRPPPPGANFPGM